MSKKYPRPPSAVAMWTEGDQMFIDFESHTVRIPLDKCSVETSSFGNPLARQLGWHTLLSMLREREIAMRTPSIGQRGAPVQYDVEQMVKAYKQKQLTVDDFNDEEIEVFLRKQGLL